MEHVTKPTAAGARRARMTSGLAAALLGLLALLPATAVAATAADGGDASVRISAGGGGTGNHDREEWNNKLDTPRPKQQ
ncbi:hypothetical protein [Streptomyces syringium]|uniref:hypothetical protein n=1 Tax=Streptomyces syringium TaxID=76729 RepID=UPI0034542278